MFIGNGLGQWKLLFPEIQRIYEVCYGTRYLQAHNEYLQVLVEHGWIGLCIILGFLAEAMYRSLKMKDIVLICGLIVTILNCGVNFLLHTNGAILFLIYLAVLEKERLVWRKL